MRTRRGMTAAVIALLTVLLIAPGGTGSATQVFPEVIPIPDGFQPEGIATDAGGRFFVGSLAGGAIYKGDLRTGDGSILVPQQSGRVAVGLSVDDSNKRLFVAGGPTGQAYVYDSRSGAEIAVLELTDAATTFVNDVVVTRSAAYFTDSFAPVIYRVPLDANGNLTGGGIVEQVPLTGDFELGPGFNANGIDAHPGGKWLLLVNSQSGRLYRVDPDTGSATEVDLQGETVTSGDGILLDGNKLYVVRNFLNQIAVVELSADHLTGAVTGEITHSNFRIPTTVAEFGSDLYAVNARFDVTPEPDTEYEIVRVSKR